MDDAPPQTPLPAATDAPSVVAAVGATTNVASAGNEGPRAARPPVKIETGFSASYVEFAKTLRTWFVAYGIGAPVLVLGQAELRNAVKGAPDVKVIAICFLGGVVLQVLAALTYKVAMWYLYMGELDASFCATKRYQISESISTALWLELLFDLGTIAAFGYATVRMLAILGT